MKESSLLNLQDVVHKPVYNITPFSALDYPDHLSAIIWFAGCNMRCDYCYNPDIVLNNGNKTIDEVLTFLKKRQGLLEAVVLSGGEATQFPELKEFCLKIKELGFKIKLDTNGTNPTMLEELLHVDLLDYVALDYKAPEEKFYEVTKNKNFKDFEKSLNLLLNLHVEFEVRTTLHSDILHVENINTIIDDLYEKGYKNTYYIQEYVKDVKTIGNISNPVKEFDKTKLSTNLHVEFRK